MVADRTCLVVAHWISRSVQWQQITFARWWHVRVLDLFGGSRSDFLGGGALEFRIYSVVEDRICPVVAH